MRLAIPAALGVLAAACAGLQPSGEAVALANPGFEEASALPTCAPGWNCKLHADPSSFRFFVDPTQPASGRASLCIEPITREPWAKASQDIMDSRVRGRRVRFSIALRTRDVVGPGAGAQAVAHGGSGQILAVQQRFVTGTHPWERIAIEMDVPPQTYILEVGGALEGTGLACLDDARLEIVR